MNKKELVAAVAEQAGLKKVDAEKAIEAFTAVVEGALKAGDKVQLVGFDGYYSWLSHHVREATDTKAGIMQYCEVFHTTAYRQCRSGHLLWV